MNSEVGEKENCSDHARGSKLADFTKNGPLSPAEEKLRKACERGEACIIGDGERPKFATEENRIRGSFLRYMILGGCEKSPIHQRGLRLSGAFISCRETSEYGQCLDLEAVTICQDLGLYYCNIDGSVILFGAKTKSFFFDGSSVHRIIGDGLQAEGNVFLRNEFYASGGVRLPSAKIDGVFDCNNGRFDGKEYSLFCEGMETKGHVFLSDGFCASSEVRLLSAKIGGDLSCDKGRFEGEEFALICTGMETNGTIYLDDSFQAYGTVWLLRVKSGGDLSCRGGQFGAELQCDNANIKGNIFLDEDFQIHGSVILPNANIGGNIYSNGGIFHHKDQAIHANRTEIGGNVILGEVNAAGTIAFSGSKIAGDFSAQGATLSGKPALQLRNSEIAGTFTWRDIKHARGHLDLGGATAKTINFDQESWQKASAIKLNNFTYQGFESLEKGVNSKYWQKFLEKQPTDDLGAKFRPRPWELLANVLQSMGFEEEARSIRIERQNRQTMFMAEYDPDRIIKSADGKERPNYMHRLSVFWRKWVSGPLVSYGYRPGNAVLYLLILWFAGSFMYFAAAHKGIMTPTHPLIFKEAVNGFIPKECAENWVHFPEAIKNQCEENIPSEYSEFNSFIYAADVVLPIVNLRMEVDWAPRVVDTSGKRDWFGWSVRSFEWFLIISGWVLSLLFASAVGGIIRR